MEVQTAGKKEKLAEKIGGLVIYDGMVIPI